MLKSFYSFVLTPRGFFIFAAVLSALSLGVAYIFQYAYNMTPCILCLYQRVPFAVVIAAAVTGVFYPPLTRPIVMAIALAFLANFSIAVFHSGVERGLWEMTDACSTNIPSVSVEELKKILMTESLSRCDQIPWQIFGLSMANLNVLLSGFMAAIGFLVWRKK